MKIEELLDFCEKRGVEVFARYDHIEGRYIIRMRKEVPEHERVVETGFGITRDVAASRGFDLTLKVILRDMANKLDKEEAHE